MIHQFSQSRLFPDLGEHGILEDDDTINPDNNDTYQEQGTVLVGPESDETDDEYFQDV